MANPRNESRPVIEGPGLLESIRQYWMLAGVLVAVFAIAGFGLAASASPTYESTARVGLTTPANIGGPAGLVRYAATIAQFAESQDVLGPAASKLHNTSAADLRDALTATPDLVANVVFITMSAPTRQAAVDRADAMIAALQAAIGNQATTIRDEKLAANGKKRDAENAILQNVKSNGSQRAAAQHVIEQIETQEIQMNSDAADFGDGVDFVTKGLLPIEPGLKTAGIQGALGGVVGFIVAVLACWIIADRRRIIDDASVPGIIADARLLGEVPVLRGGAGKALGKFVEMPAPAFEFAAAGLWSGIESGVVLVSGVERGAGSTTTAANLGAAFARDGRRVVIVDADGSDRSITEIAGIPKGTAGLSDVLTLRSPLEEALRAVDLGDATSVAVLPSGAQEADIASLMRGKTMTEILDRLREWYDLVIIDVPPLTTDAQGASLARNVDGVLFVVPRGVRMRRVERLRERLDLLSLPVLGYVFNRDQAIDVSVNRTRTNARR